eukprot:CAMPEP_0170510764 /NCGR_PEP_ID=MMETSP0208-20121228/65939_1 /TAXON_ID=197538 /ORGANISM="Strombidium inclinatum, Strain S3" /LENGTH=160 /DNA_ID=CAMNT_0010794251 /DNA_START=4025 /DNA_END=4507 /DNA_ORIENTATION=-
MEDSVKKSINEMKALSVNFIGSFLAMATAYVDKLKNEDKKRAVTFSQATNSFRLAKCRDALEVTESKWALLLHLKSTLEGKVQNEVVNNKQVEFEVKLPPFDQSDTTAILLGVIREEAALINQGDTSVGIHHPVAFFEKLIEEIQKESANQAQSTGFHYL